MAMKLISIFLKDEPAAGKQIPTRDQIAIEDTWDLAPLYPTPDAWHADFLELQRSYPEIVKFKAKQKKFNLRVFKIG